MKTGLHIAIILAAGVVTGLLIRISKTKSSVESSSRVVYTNSEPNVAPETVTEDEPSPAPEGWMSEFELIERSGKKVSSEQLKGQPYVVSFFFSTCPSVCIQQNQKVQELQSLFENEGVRFVSISVDPVTDSPEALREYAARFKADNDQWLFMTGDLLYIRRVGAEVFRLAVDEKFHTEKFVLVGADGQIIGYYSWPEPRQFDKLKTDIRELLGNKS